VSRKEKKVREGLEEGRRDGGHGRMPRKDVQGRKEGEGRKRRIGGREGGREGGRGKGYQVRMSRKEGRKERD
jgi:hypothetical protein